MIFDILKGRKKKVKTASKIKDNKLKQSLQELDKDINELAKDSFKKLIGDQYERLGELYIERGDFDKADEYFNKAKSLMKESSISNNSRVEWLCIINQYFIYSATSMFDEEAEKIDINKIITDLREMYRKRLDKNDIEDAALLSMYLSILLDATKDEGAIEFLKKAYDLYKQIDNKKNLGRVCLAFGLFYLNNNNLEENFVKNFLLKNNKFSILPKLSQISFAEINTYLQNILLRDADQMGMAHTLEIRVPFLDHKLIENVFGISDEFKFPHTPKKLLTDSFENLIPKEIINRQKMGFVLPYEKWLKNEIFDFANSKIINLSKQGFFNEKSIKSLWKNFLKNDKRVSWSRVWHLIVFQNILEKNKIF